MDAAAFGVLLARGVQVAGGTVRDAKVGMYTHAAAMTLGTSRRPSTAIGPGVFAARPRAAARAFRLIMEMWMPLLTKDRGTTVPL